MSLCLGLPLTTLRPHTRRHPRRSCRTGVIRGYQIGDRENSLGSNGQYSIVEMKATRGQRGLHPGQPQEVRPIWRGGPGLQSGWHGVLIQRGSMPPPWRTVRAPVEGSGIDLSCGQSHRAAREGLEAPSLLLGPIIL